MTKTLSRAQHALMTVLKMKHYPEHLRLPTSHMSKQGLNQVAMINGIMIAVNMGNDNCIIYGQTQNFRAAFMVYGNKAFQIQVNDIKVQQVRKID